VVFVAGLPAGKDKNKLIECKMMGYNKKPQPLGQGFLWSWRDLNPRPNKQRKCFLHA
jgi:hypothetical protein